MGLAHVLPNGPPFMSVAGECANEPVTESSPLRRVTAFTATCVLISNVIGSGIFTTTGFMARDVGDPTWIMALWIVGGLLALAGAMCYGELGAALPIGGGEYVYLRHAYGSLVGFLSGWASFTVGFGAAIAAAAVAFASYVLQFMSPDGDTSVFIVPIALALVWILTGVHVAGVGTGGIVQQVLTVLKVGALVGLIVGAAVIGKGSLDNWHVTTLDQPPTFGTLMVALIFVTYSYSGWNAAAYIAGEIVRPARSIPVTMIAGTLVVCILYAALNLVYVYALPVTTLAEPPVLPVAEKAAVAMFGPQAAQVVAGILSVSIAGATSAMIWAGPRVYYAMARDGLFPSVFAKTGGDATPSGSIVLQSGWATILILSGTFEQLVIYSGVMLTIFTALAVGSVIVLRVRNPELPRPYQVPGYPFIPGLFLVAAAAIVLATVIERPIESAWGILTVLAGIPVYVFFARLASRDSTISSTMKSVE